MLAVYAIVNGNQEGWTSAQTVGLLAAAAVLFVVFLGIEARVSAPLMPLALFRLRNVAVANVVGVLWAGGHVRVVLPLGALPAARARLQPARGRARVPAGQHDHGRRSRSGSPRGSSCGTASGSRSATGFTRRRRVLLFARAPVDGSFVVDVLPSMILLGFGAGMAFNPVLLAAMSDVEPKDAGLASGVVNTAFMMGGALGLAVLASLRRGAHRHAHRRGRGGARGAHRRLPPGLPARRAVRGHGGRARSGAAPVAGDVARGRAHPSWPRREAKAPWPRPSAAHRRSSR